MNFHPIYILYIWLSGIFMWCAVCLLAMRKSDDRFSQDDVAIFLLMGGTFWPLATIIVILMKCSEWLTSWVNREER